MPDEPAPGIQTSHYLPISVIVITRDEERNIRECLDSLTSVDYPQDRFEVLVIDSSTDATPEIVSGYKDVRLVRSEKGFSQQRNTGIKAASYDILAFVDADGFVSKDWLKAIHNAFQNEKIAAIGGNGFPPPRTRYFGLCVSCIGHPAGGAIGFDANVTQSEKGVEFVPGCNFAFRRQVLADVGEFDPSFYDGGEDIDFSRRLKREGYYIDYIPDLTFYHKPRSTLPEYIKWNIGVGVTKYNLTKSSMIKLLLQPSFPLWSLLFLLALILLIPRFVMIALLLALGWGLFLVFLYLKTKPFPLLIQRRKKIGIDLFSIMTVVPFLIYLRQVCINVGQIRKLLKIKFPSSFRK